MAFYFLLLDVLLIHIFALAFSAIHISYFLFHLSIINLVKLLQFSATLSATHEKSKVPKLKFFYYFSPQVHVHILPRKDGDFPRVSHQSELSSELRR
jgi:hypothetical protein